MVLTLLGQNEDIVEVTRLLLWYRVSPIYWTFIYFLDSTRSLHPSDRSPGTKGGDML